MANWIKDTVGGQQRIVLDEYVGDNQAKRYGANLLKNICIACLYI